MTRPPYFRYSDAPPGDDPAARRAICFVAVVVPTDDGETVTPLDGVVMQSGSDRRWRAVDADGAMYPRRAAKNHAARDLLSGDD